MISLKNVVVLLIFVFITPIQSKTIDAFSFDDGKAYIRALDEPDSENSPISICLRIFPFRIKDSVIPLVGVRLENLDKEERFEAVKNIFLEVWFISNEGRMENGDKPFQIQAVHYNFKNNGDMGQTVPRYPYEWYHLCVGFQKTGPLRGEQLYYINGEKIFHGQNMPISNKYAWLKGNKLKVFDLKSSFSN